MAFDIKVNPKIKIILVISFCLILLFGTWFFRWKQVAAKTVNGVKKIYLTDRWTGQNWIKSICVSHEGKLYDGYMIPYILEEEINAKGKEILYGATGKKRKNDLQVKMDEAKANKEQVSKGHTQYEQLYEEYEEEYKAKFIEPLLPPEENVYDRALKELELLGEGKDIQMANSVNNRIPEKLKEDNDAWEKYDDLERKYWHQIRNVSSWANKEAEKTLRAEAYSTKKIATYIWLSLLGIALIVADIQAVIYRKKQNKNYIGTHA